MKPLLLVFLTSCAAVEATAPRAPICEEASLDIPPSTRHPGGRHLGMLCCCPAEGGLLCEQRDVCL